MAERVVRFGLIGGGLMGREFASAAARWVHLADIGVRPEIAVVCDLNPEVLAWYERLEPRPPLVSDYRELLEDASVEAVYCAVPHHLHEELYTAVLDAGKHLLGEKPFGIDLAANDAINAGISAHPELLVRCSSEFPFFPGGQGVFRFIRERRFGRVLEVRSQFLHSSDLDPGKPINWKRRAELNGEYGCMGDLGMHALHLPLRAGWMPLNVSAILSDVVTERPDGSGGWARCDTWDNALLLCEAGDGDVAFPLRIETKRIAPGETNTWATEIDGTQGSIAFSTKLPKTLRFMDYRPGGRQAWQTLDLGSQSAYPTISGAIFESRGGGFDPSAVHRRASLERGAHRSLDHRFFPGFMRPFGSKASHTVAPAPKRGDVARRRPRVDRVGVFSERLAQLGLEQAGFRGRAVGFDDYQETAGIRHAHRKAAPHSLDAPRPGFPLDARAAARDSHAVDDNDVISTMTTPSPPPPLLEARNVQKHFGRVVALRDGNFTLRPNEVHALVGDNGAGKSTLVKILSGVDQADAGEIAIDGRPVTIANPREARELGIETVYQDLALAGHLDASGNLFLGREQLRPPPLSWFGFLDKKAMRRRAQEEMRRLKIGIHSVDQPVLSLSGGQRQAVAVARAIAWGTRIVIMDEPTAALGVRESSMVLELIKEVRSQGLAVIMISHNLPEVFAVADRITVLRLGKTIVTLDKSDTSLEAIVGMMTGALAVAA